MVFIYIYIYMMALNSEESLLKSLRNSFENHRESQLGTQFFGCAPLVARGGHFIRSDPTRILDRVLKKKKKTY